MAGRAASTERPLVHDVAVHHQLQLERVGLLRDLDLQVAACPRSEEGGVVGGRSESGEGEERQHAES